MAESIVDACCLINLFASGKESSIFRTCGQLWVPTQVQSEALCIRRIDEDDPGKLVSQDIDVGAAVSQGYIHSCSMEGADEWDAFVGFAMQLADGEASCLAIARSRGWTVATDDRKARRIACENGISLISTPGLIQRWIDATSSSEAAVVEVLRSIERFARFRPRRSDPLYGWWTTLTETN